MKRIALSCAALLALVPCSWSLWQEPEGEAPSARVPQPGSYSEFLRAWEGKSVSISSSNERALYHLTIDPDGQDLILSVGTDYVQVWRRGRRYALPLSVVVVLGW